MRVPRLPVLHLTMTFRMLRDRTGKKSSQAALSSPAVRKRTNFRLCFSCAKAPLPEQSDSYTLLREPLIHSAAYLAQV